MKVMSAEANFMRVRVTESTADSGDHPRDELLCVVRKLLKKMNRNVLVGDRVRVDRVDWVDGRGELLQSSASIPSWNCFYRGHCTISSSS